MVPRLGPLVDTANLTHQAPSTPPLLPTKTRCTCWLPLSSHWLCQANSRRAHACLYTHSSHTLVRHTHICTLTQAGHTCLSAHAHAHVHIHPDRTHTCIHGVLRTPSQAWFLLQQTGSSPSLYTGSLHPEGSREIPA